MPHALAIGFVCCSIRNVRVSRGKTKLDGSDVNGYRIRKEERESVT